MGLSAGDWHHEDVNPSRPVGVERDVPAIRRPRGVHIGPLIAGQLNRRPSVGGCDPDIAISTSIRKKSDAASVWRYPWSEIRSSVARYLLYVVPVNRDGPVVELEIVNRDLVLMTLDSDDVTIDIDLTVERGVGYLGVERTDALPIGAPVHVKL